MFREFLLLSFDALASPNIGKEEGRSEFDDTIQNIMLIILLEFRDIIRNIVYP